MESGAWSPRKLSLLRVLSGAFILPWQHRGEVVRQAGLPMLLVAVTSMVWGLYFSDSLTARWLSWLVYVVLCCWLAVTVHRLVLVDQPGSPLEITAAALRRLASFFALSVVFWLVYSGARLLLFSGALAVLGSRYVPAGEPPGEIPVSPGVLDSITSALAYVVISRLALLLPATAAGERLDAIALWRKSVGNSWRLAVVVGLLPWLLAALTSMLTRDGASDFEWCLLQVIVSVTLVIEVVALSLAYRELTAPELPPTNPPG